MPDRRRYFALNPVRAGARDWPHSSARAHAGRDDGLVDVRPLLEREPRFADLLEADPDEGAFVALRRGELIGRPLGAPGISGGDQPAARAQRRAGQARAKAEGRARSLDGAVRRRGIGY